jgi:quercetin dioxygenase-like cupin family protein
MLGILTGSLAVGPQGLGAAAAETPAEPTVIMNGEFAPPAGLTAFKAMTFVLDIGPGVSVPYHSHSGKSQILVLEGEMTLRDLKGVETVYRKGDNWIEEPDDVHAGRNAGKETARVVWTILLPEGAELEVPYKE